MRSPDNTLENKDGVAKLREIPSVGLLLDSDELLSLAGRFSRRTVREAVQKEIEAWRQTLLSENYLTEGREFSIKSLIEAVIRRLEAETRNSIRHAVNATGVLLHTGLGRAPLAPAARQALSEAALRYSTLAIDIETGARGDRFAHVSDLLIELTGAESALVVNNNAAAVLLALNTLSDGLEAIISRGELVEIGGMFRIPDVMRRAGVEMIEVGTTNRTHLNDYNNAIGERTGMILKVHPSNYRIEGFHREVSVEQLAKLASQKDLPFFYDAGSGALVDLSRWNLPAEPTIQQAIADGAGIVAFSGDKLVGGPQCGILVGKQTLISRCKKNPLLRAIRPDKLTLAVLEGTLKLFRDPDRLPLTHPLYAMLAMSTTTLRKKAERLRKKLNGVIKERGSCEIAEGFSVMGSGALPARNIPTILVRIIMENHSAEWLAKSLRKSESPVFTRIEDDRVLFDMRTVQDDEIDLIYKSILNLLNKSC